MKKLAVIAIGGNSLIEDKNHKTVNDQYNAIKKTCENIISLVKNDYNVIITHGNGPQVGFILRRTELAKDELHMVPLDSCGADTQGAIGYQIQKAMYNLNKKQGINKNVATVVTQVLVDANDPSFLNPSKPIGSFMEKEEAFLRKEKDGWDIIEDAGRGWRRVVASPKPKEIIELEAIKKLIENDFMVVAVGGGGIPVVYDKENSLIGSEAVIDKDFASSLLAQNLNADLFIISTAVSKVCLNFGKENEKSLDRITLDEAKQYITEGHFAKGSMLPKIEAVIEYLQNSDGEAIITDPNELDLALKGESGTRVIK